MSNYTFQQDLQKIWDKAVTLYEAGNRQPGTYFDRDELAFLAGIGHSAQEVYDFAEDWVKHGEPDFGTFLLVAAQRRQFFLEVMGGRPAKARVDMDSLPAKTAQVRGIEWLPRIIPKARAKLRGEMPDELMFGCGGDRAFFKRHDIHPAEFLAVVAANFGDDEAIIDFVARRAEASARK